MAFNLNDSLTCKKKLTNNVWHIVAMISNLLFYVSTFQMEIFFVLINFCQINPMKNL